jgi:iron complex outermembrane receptor protein
MKHPARRPICRLTALLMLSTAASAWAQSRDGEIVVTATREQQAALEEIEPERSVDADGVASYGASTIGEVLDSITSEMGDTDEPVLFVNGVPITDPGDIVDYPAEAIERIDVLPRGAGARLGARTDKRAYNVVLKRVFASNIGTVRDRLATDGGWNSIGGELIFSRISGQERLNLTLSARDENDLRESERGLIQPMPLFPYDLAGNLIADPRSGVGEIDPVLSAAAGRPVTVAAVPVGVGSPALADFAAGAGQPNLTHLGQFRTLRPATRAYEASLNVNRPLTGWLSAALTGRISQDTFDYLQGLPAAVFILPSDSPFSPFGRDVAIARYLDDEPLTSRTRFLRGSLGLALNATRGPWQLTLRGDYRYSRYRTDARRQSTFAPILLEPGGGSNPFADDLGSLVPLYSDRSSSVNQNAALQVSATGPLFELPAGPLRANLNAGLRHIDQSGFSDSPFFQSRRSLDRHERLAQGSLEIPLTSRERGVLGAIGDLSLTLDHALTDVARLGSVRRHGYAANWRPVSRLTLQGSINKQRLLPETEQLGEAVYVAEGVRYFDVATGETLDVTQISGGNPDLQSESVTTRRLSATADMPTRIELQLNGEFLATRRNNPISLLPPTSAELMAAFPERFVRDAAGRLISVDVRPINFVRRSSEQFRWGVILTAPLGQTPPPGAPPAPGASRLRLQATLSHTVNLKDDVLARAGLPVVDLLDGGAVGFGGGTTRHLIDAGLNLNDREVGVRFNATWRSAALLNAGTAAAPGRLRFSPLATFNLRTFAALDQLWPKERWLKGTKLSLNMLNLFNARQDVRDASGAIPLRYQPAYRDPLGRTVEIELRKAF